MMPVYMPDSPYLRAIELHLRDAFPGRKVTVWSAESPFDFKNIIIRVSVDKFNAYFEYYKVSNLLESDISNFLIRKIKEAMDNEDKN